MIVYFKYDYVEHKSESYSMVLVTYHMSLFFFILRRLWSNPLWDWKTL